MPKSAISWQNPHIGTGTESGNWYPMDRGKVVPVPKVGGTGTPFNSKGLLPVPELPATLFLYPLHC